MQNATRSSWLAAAASVAVLLGACDGPSLPITEPGLPAASVTPAGANGERRSVRVTGRAHLTVRKLGEGGPLGRTVRSETGRYDLTIGGSGDPLGTITLSDGTIPIVLYAERSDQRRRGRWERTLPSDPGKEVRSVVFTAGAGAPPAEIEIRVSGRPIARIARAWERADGGWQLRQQVITVIERGKPALSLTIDFDNGVSTEATADALDGRPVPFRSASLADAGFSVPMPDRPAADEGGMCEAEVRAMEDAFVVYEGAAVLMGICLAGPTPCFSATVALLAAAVKFDVAVTRLEKCLAKPEF